MNKLPLKNKSQTGFTLIELIIVIVILGVSLLEALFILPSHLAHLKKETNKNKWVKKLEGWQRTFANAFDRFIENKYRVKTDGDSRALAGLSMGGLQTLYTGIQNTDMFSYLGVFSSGWFANNDELAGPQYDFMKEHTEKINSNLDRFFISMGGEEDIAYQNCQVMMEKFDEMGIQYEYSEYPGGHTWPVWRHDLYKFTQLLFKD